MSKRTRATRVLATGLSTLLVSGVLSASLSSNAQQEEVEVQVVGLDVDVAVVPFVVAPGAPDSVAVGPAIPIDVDPIVIEPPAPAPAPTPAPAPGPAPVPAPAPAPGPSRTAPASPTPPRTPETATPTNVLQYPEPTVPAGVDPTPSERPSKEPSDSPTSNRDAASSTSSSAKKEPEQLAREETIGNNPDAFVFTIDTRLTPHNPTSFALTALGFDDDEPNFEVFCDVKDPGNRFRLEGASGDAVCNYKNPGKYTLMFKGKYPHVKLGVSDRQASTAGSLVSVDSWGMNVWRSMEGMFQKANNLEFAPDSGTPNMTQVQSTAYMFEGATLFNGDISGWNTGNVRDMSGMFMNAHAFNSNISGWDTSRVESMPSMFQSAHSFSADISGWNTANVRNMNDMFTDAKAFDVNLRTWNLASIQKLNSIFDNSGLSPINYSSTLDGWVRQQYSPYGLNIGAAGVYWCPHPSFDETLTKLTEKGWTRNDAGAAEEYQGPVISVVNKEDLDSDKDGPVTIKITTDEPLRAISPEWKEVPTEPNTYSRVFEEDETITVKAWDNYGNPSLSLITVSGFDITPTSVSEISTMSPSLRIATMTAFIALLLLLAVFGAYVVYDRRTAGKDTAYLRLKEMQRNT